MNNLLKLKKCKKIEEKAKKMRKNNINHSMIFMKKIVDIFVDGIEVETIFFL